MGPLEWVSDIATSGMILAFNWFSAHPRVSGGLTLVFGGSYVTNAFLRGWWPERAHRPRLVCVALDLCGPFVAVVRGGLGRLRRLASGGRPAPSVAPHGPWPGKRGRRPRRGGRAS